jgi:hypothetical protein
MVVAPALTPLMVMVPSAKPLQDTFVAEAFTVTAIGSVIVTEVVAVQNPSAFPLGAVAVIKYVPGAKVVWVLKSGPAPSSWIVVVAPALKLLMVIIPSAKPLQDTFVAEALTVTAIGSVIVTDAVDVQNPSAFPFGAVAVIKYVPGAKVVWTLKSGPTPFN